MCICCPPAISALFCLWLQSGCSKGTVAGALTFFPPEPALYQFERKTCDGRVLGNDEEADDENDATNKNDDQEKPNEAPIEIRETREETNRRMKSPIEQLTEQARERKQRAAIRHLRDVRDANANIQYSLLLDPRLQVPPHDEDSIVALKIKSVHAYIAAVLYQVPPNRRTRHTKTIVISHGNATDNGAMFPIQVVLAHALDCNVVVYDYSGYGESGGVPDERTTYTDIESVYDYLIHTLKLTTPENIVLYGQSVGSGPCCYLASQSTIGGMILHSPFTSGMRVLTPSRLLACLDIFPNIDRIQHVQAPVMILHGALDQEVDLSHGVELHRAVPDRFKREPWWVPDRGHNDITDGPGRLAEYIRRLRAFMNSLDAAPVGDSTNGSDKV